MENDSFVVKGQYTLVKDNNLYIGCQDTIPVPQTTIGERIQNIHSHTGEIYDLIKRISEGIYTVSGNRIEFEHELRGLARENIADDLLSVEHNVSFLSNALRTCVDTLVNSL